jgi:hypothetical protein
VLGPIGAICGIAAGDVFRGVAAGLVIAAAVAAVIDLARTSGGIHGERPSLFYVTSASWGPKGVD